MREKLLRAAGTALAAGTLALRAARMPGNWESVRDFFLGGGPAWTLVGAAMLAGPWLAAVLAAAAFWLPRERAARLGTAAACAAGFFVLEEGLTAFARAVNGNGGYVGAEPLLSLLVLGTTILAACRGGREAGPRGPKDYGKE